MNMEKISSLPKLLPCPDCGSTYVHICGDCHDPETPEVYDRNGFRLDEYIAILCFGCRRQGSVRFDDGVYDWESRLKACVAWNTTDREEEVC